MRSFYWKILWPGRKKFSLFYFFFSLARRKIKDKLYWFLKFGVINVVMESTVESWLFLKFPLILQKKSHINQFLVSKFFLLSLPITIFEHIKHFKGKKLGETLLWLNYFREYNIQPKADYLKRKSRRKKCLRRTRKSSKKKKKNRYLSGMKNGSGRNKHLPVYEILKKSIPKHVLKWCKKRNIVGELWNVIEINKEPSSGRRMWNKGKKNMFYVANTINPETNLVFYTNTSLSHDIFKFFICVLRERGNGFTLNRILKCLCVEENVMKMDGALKSRILWASEKVLRNFHDEIELKLCETENNEKACMIFYRGELFPKQWKFNLTSKQ